MGVTHWNMLWNTEILEKTGELPVEDQLRQTPTVAGAYLEDA